MARIDAADLSHRLGQQAEAVCRHYLSNGRKQGNYWQVGDVRNEPGRSMFVRVTGPASESTGSVRSDSTAAGSRPVRAATTAASSGRPAVRGSPRRRASSRH